MDGAENATSILHKYGALSHLAIVSILNDIVQ